MISEDKADPNAEPKGPPPTEHPTTGPNGPGGPTPQDRKTQGEGDFSSDFGPEFGSSNSTREVEEKK